MNNKTPFTAKRILIALVTLFTLTVLPWCLAFLGNYKYATTEDFANFGDYIGGIFTPVAITVTVLIAIFQGVKHSQIATIERIYADFKDRSSRLTKRIEALNEGDLCQVYMKAKKASMNGKSPFIAIQEYYKENANLFSNLEVLALTLKQLEKLDEDQFRIALQHLKSEVDHVKFQHVEVLTFFLRAPGTDAAQYYWVDPINKQNYAGKQWCNNGGED